MYQLEAKHHLVRHRFHPRDGWQVTVDVDAMERAKGNQHKPEKRAVVEEAERNLLALGARIGAHSKFGRTDVVAEASDGRIVLVEVEGDSSRQKEQAFYSALGQVLLMVRSEPELSYAVAVPDSPQWEHQLRKVSQYAVGLLHLELLLVSPDGVRECGS